MGLVYNLQKIGGDMKGVAVRSVRVVIAVIATVVMIRVLVGERMLHAQIMTPPTIDSRDTRSMEDTRGQDPRQNPGPVPPSAIELMKRLNEGQIPDSTEESDSSKDQGDGAKTKDVKPHGPPSQGK